MYCLAKSNKNRGFTLIELLVVISIISLMSSVVLSTINTTRAKARDRVRQSDIHQIQAALELYKNDFGAYPIASGAPPLSTLWAASNHPTSWGTLGTALAPYIKLPNDPKEEPVSNGFNYPGSTATCCNMYMYRTQTVNGCTAGQWYVLLYRTEASTFQSPGVKMCDGSVINISANNAISIGSSQI